MTRMSFCYSLCSSSKGNATYIGDSRHGILIDAGLSCRQFCLQLAAMSIDPGAVQAIFITHEHTDHIKGLFQIAKKLCVPIYGSRPTLEALVKKDQIPSGAVLHEIRTKSAEYADKIAYATVDGNIPYFWRISQPSDFVTSGGAAGYTKGDTWLISNSILLNGSCDPDAGVAIKNISQSLEIYSHTYEEAGTYTATFVANNANYVHQGGQVVRELTINVVE